MKSAPSGSGLLPDAITLFLSELSSNDLISRIWFSYKTSTLPSVRLIPNMLEGLMLPSISADRFSRKSPPIGIMLLIVNSEVTLLK